MASLWEEVFFGYINEDSVTDILETGQYLMLKFCKICCYQISNFFLPYFQIKAWTYFRNICFKCLFSDRDRLRTVYLPCWKLSAIGTADSLKSASQLAAITRFVRKSFSNEYFVKFCSKEFDLLGLMVTVLFTSLCSVADGPCSLEVDGRTAFFGRIIAGITDGWNAEIELNHLNNKLLYCCYVHYWILQFFIHFIGQN